jgi:hypothetical protein
MAQNTAQYEALQYTSQAPVFDYGSITRGVNELVATKKAEDEKKAKELEDQKLQLLRDYGDEIYSNFELTGLENTDQIGLDAKNLIVERAEGINKMLANGEISMSDASRMMMSIRNQSKKASEQISGLAEYANAIREKGDKASPSDILKLDRIDNMISNGVSVAMDNKNNMMYISQEDGKMVTSPFSKVKSYYTFSDNLQPDGVVDTVMKNSAMNTYKIGNRKVSSVLNRDNELTDNQKNAYTSFVGELSPEDAYDLGINSGLNKEELGAMLDGEISFKDRKSVDKKIVEKLIETTKTKYGNQVIDEVTGAKLSMEEARLELAKQSAAPKANKKVSFTETSDAFIYTGDVSEQKKVPAINLGGNSYRDVIVTSYKKSKIGGPDEVTVSYTGASEGLTEEQKFFGDDKGTTQTATIQLTDPTEVAFVRNILNLSTDTKDLPSGGTTVLNKDFFKQEK